MERTTMQRNGDGTLPAYAWPGGYPLYYVTADGGVLCPDDANMAEREGLANDPDDPQWYIIAQEVNWEDTDLVCDHGGEHIPSAYGDDE